MNWNYTCKYLIIADFEYHRILLNYKNKNPQLNYKVMSKEQVLDMLSFAYVKDPIPMLLQKEKYDYSKLKKLLKVLRVADISQSEYLTDLKAKLNEEGFLQEDDLGKYELNQKTILLFEAGEDKELQLLLKRNGYDFELLHFEDVDEPQKCEKQPPLLLYPDKFTQYFALFADMRRRIVAEKADPEKFVIYADIEDSFYVSWLAQIFSLNVRILIEEPMISDHLVKEAINQFYQKRNFDYTGEVQENSSLAQLLKLVEYYQLKKIEDFDFAYSNLMEILAGYKQLDTVTDKGVAITNRLSFDDNYYYITNFVFDTFYKVFDDNNVFEDAFLETIGCNTSYVQTDMDRRKKTNYLIYNKVISASRVKLHLGDKIFDSQLLKERGWKIAKGDFLADGYYTPEALALLKTKFKDDLRAKPDAEYKTYDHHYQKANVPPPERNSVSALKTYYHCPFSYFCDRVLKLDDKNPDNDWYNASFGVLVHKIFEHIFDVNFDFDKAFEEGLVAFKEDYQKKHCTFTSKDEIWINNAKEDVRLYAQLVHDQLNHASIQKEAAEQEIHFSLHSPKTDREYPFIGFIDKLVYSVADNGDRYFTVVDYKTGGEDFDIKNVFLGGSLQLPLYSYCLLADPSQELVSGYQFAGFGIQHIFLKKPSKDKNSINVKTVQKKLTVGGISSLDESYLKSIDNTFFKENGNMNKHGKYIYASYPFIIGNKDSVLCKNDYTYQDLFDDALKAAITNLDRIYDNDFPIAPVLEKKNGDPSCTFCKFRDVCYRQLDDVHDVTGEIMRRFSEVEESEDEEDESL